MIHSSQSYRYSAWQWRRHFKFGNHITSIVQVCNYQSKAMHRVRPLINKETANTIACSTVCTRYDNCYSVLCRITKLKGDCLQRVDNALVCIVYTEQYSTHTSHFIGHLTHFIYYYYDTLCSPYHRMLKTVQQQIRFIYSIIQSLEDSSE